MEQQVTGLDGAFLVLAENLEDGLVVWGSSPEADTPPTRPEDLFLLYANPSAAVQGSANIHERVGMSLIEAFPPLAESGFPGTMLEVLETGTPRHLAEFRYGDERSPDADYELRLVPLDRHRLTVVYRNLTTRRALQRRVARVVELAPNPTLLHAEGGEVLEISDSWCHMTGYRRAELDTIQAWTHRAYGLAQAEVEEVIRDLYQLEEPTREGEFVIRLADGSERVWDFASAPVGALEDGRRVVMSTAVDVTDRRRVEAEFERLVRVRTEGLENFTSRVSHDLRAPMRAVRSYSQILTEDHGERLPDEGRDLLGRLVGAVDRMENLLQAMIRLAKVQVQSVARQTVDLTAEARACVEEIEAANPDNGVECVIAQGMEAQGDPGLVRQVLANLLGNAFKFSGKGEGGRVEVGWDPEAKPPRFWIQDQGAGFDPTYAEKIFQPFERLHTHHDFAGHGLGLAIVHRIIQLHGGVIEARSIPGEGARFSFTLEPHGPRPGRLEEASGS